MLLDLGSHKLEPREFLSDDAVEKCLEHIPPRNANNKDLVSVRKRLVLYKSKLKASLLEQLYEGNLVS